MTLAIVALPQPVADAADLPRAALRRAIAGRSETKSRVDEAAKASSESKRFLDEATARLNSFVDLDDTIAAHRTNVVKHAASSGGKPTWELPGELLDQRQGRDRAQEDCASARAVCARLDADLAEAGAALRSADQELSDAAVAVMQVEGERLAKELLAVKRRAFSLLRRLNSLGSFWAPAPTPRAFPISRRAIDAIHYDATVEQFNEIPGSAQAVAVGSWRDWHSRLITDSDAEFEPAKTQPQMPDLDGPEHVASRLRGLREKLGLLQAEFAETIGCSQSSVSKWETGTYVLDAELALRVARRHHITMDWIYRGR